MNKFRTKSAGFVFYIIAGQSAETSVLIKLFFAASDENDNADQNNYGNYYDCYNSSCTHALYSPFSYLYFTI